MTYNEDNAGNTRNNNKTSQDGINDSNAIKSGTELSKERRYSETSEN